MLGWVYAPRIEDTAAVHHETGFSWLWSWTAKRRRQRLRRNAMATLLRVDADTLRDITGLERLQVEAAARLPLSIDALDRLQQMQRADSITAASRAVRQ
ncbi:hypothetical protein LQ948_12460 [Jiella sp. MQZ9-1]|uniref:DUF1127 domain-containing protein n=1 Tax=Jiella flava TaxID=2816857 RepID=A0A939FXT0_9HYPH|nr:hypothetical protein [Jiella flava]MBO0663447.1 hypothetical protein [Jiella flava]MCD2472022.1 hypothetical protein [Jiella flava]